MDKLLVAIFIVASIGIGFVALTALLGWWWIDAMAALALVLYACPLRQRRHASYDTPCAKAGKPSRLEYAESGVPDGTPGGKRSMRSDRAWNAP